jgi:hypothetical protein
LLFGELFDNRKNGFDGTAMQRFAQPEDRSPSSNSDNMNAGTHRSTELIPGGDNSKAKRVLGELELDSALQLLVERAQYITGATGTALALPQGDEMVCRASAGSSAPALGARLQVLSGLTGESILRRQLLRCDNAETDPRVNLETCRALGIASIVVLPLFRQNGEIRGLIELFSDHPYAFEERDLIALERMADLTLTALDLAEQRDRPNEAPTLRRREPEKLIESKTSEPAPRELAGPVASESKEYEAPVAEPATDAPAEAMVVPDSMRRMQKCASCGFPISEGRTVCLDCEKKKQVETRGEIKPPGEEQRAASSSPSLLKEPKADEFIPAFLANAPPVSESWMANHVNLLAIIVLILGVLVAIVVFR